MKKRKIGRSGIIDPFKDLAYGLITEDADIYEEEPVDIQQFVEDKKFLGLKWNNKRSQGCRPKIMEILIAVMKPDIREATIILGKGAGKDFLASIANLYGAYKCLCMYSPQLYYGLSPGSPIYFVNTARNENQAKNVFFKEFLGMLFNCPWFSGKCEDPGIQQVNFEKNVIALSVNSQSYGWLGYNTLQWVGDELAWFLENDTNEESDSRAEACWDAAYGSCQTRFPRHYKMIGITTPRYDDDFVMNKVAELKQRPDGYHVQAATWDIHPNLTIEDFKYRMATDERKTMRDFGAVASGVIESLWPDPDFLRENVCEACLSCPVYAERETQGNEFSCWEYDDCKGNAYAGNGQWRDWFKPNPDYLYYLHFDLAVKKDRLGFALSHIQDTIKVELDTYEVKQMIEQGKISKGEIDDEDRYEDRPLIKVDAVGFVTARRDFDENLLRRGEIHYDSVMKYLILHLAERGCNIALVTFDQYQSVHLKQNLEDRDITTGLLSLDRNIEVPLTAKNAIVENRVEYPYNALLCAEAKHLKVMKANKIDHDFRSSKDVWDGFAGSIYNCEVNQDYAGAFESLTDYIEDEDD